MGVRWPPSPLLLGMPGLAGSDAEAQASQVELLLQPPLGLPDLPEEALTSPSAEGATNAVSLLLHVKKTN